MVNPNILVVEDEEAILELISLNLYQNNMNPIRAINAVAADGILKNSLPDLILLDWMMPEVSGLDYLKKLRANTNTKNLPVIMLTAKDQELNKLEGLDNGADDYITKPFSPRELISRIKTVLRRKAPDLIQNRIKLKNIEINPEKHEIISNGKLIKLGPTEYKLLYLFMANNEKVLSRELIIDKIWKNESNIDDRTVDVHIKRLRAALKEVKLDKIIETIRGSGYKLIEN
ncbi:MAG: response regulator [Nitrosomonadales bacterium]|jgi:two-component system phosphate regulon response regulator PhoB